MSATEKTYQTCLPPEAYLRITKACDSKGPRFKSSVYPQSVGQKVKKATK